MLRLRARYTAWPRPVIELTDTPRPDCCVCAGKGGYQTGSPVDEEPLDMVCGCWDPSRAWLLIPVPKRAAARWLGWTESDWTTDAPF